jgi:1,2-diacylglycerol 3-beta-galactosyltransferase
MDHHQPEKPKILFLFSDTGGGHRSGAEAIIEALELEYPGQFTTEMVDFFKEYAPRPINLAPDIYPAFSRMSDIWEFTYRASDGKRRTRAVYTTVYPYVRRALHRLLGEHPCDLIVSVHPLSNTPVLRALKHHTVPFVTVVTDMVTTHAFWYDGRADLVIVPTEVARQRGLDMGLRPDQVRVVGMPVAYRFRKPMDDSEIIRQRLGWPPDLPVILLIGGGEGMGPLDLMAYAIERLHRPAALVVVCGRNRKLKSSLEKHKWSLPAFIYGFVGDMPDFMGAADILITKAGPGTISEAFIAGLPLILYSRIPGQEDGNVTYVVDEGAGIWAPDPKKAAAVVKRWLDDPKERKFYAEASRRLATPEATTKIAQLIAAQAGIKTGNNEG